MTTVHVLLPAHNRREVTRRFVESLAAQTHREVHLLLVDDGSVDGTADMVRDVIPGATVLRGAGDWWWAGSLQQGLDWLRAQAPPADDVVLIANDDTVLDPEFLATALDALRTRPRTLLQAQAYSITTKKPLDRGVNVDWRRLAFTQAQRPEDINCLSTRGLFLRVEELFELGDFHTRLLPHYGSDYELTIRASRRGMRLLTLPSIKLWMDESTTGIRHVDERSVSAVWRTTMSKRSVSNPFYWTTFIALACPPHYVPHNLARVWGGFARRLVRAYRAEGSPRRT